MFYHRSVKLTVGRSWIIWSLCLCLLLTGCMSPMAASASQSPVTVHHELGETTVKSPPKRVVLTDPYLLEVTSAMRIHPIGVAKENEKQTGIPSYLKGSIQTNFKWVGTKQQPDLNAILKLKPDLIIADVGQKQWYPQFSSMAPTLVVRGTGADHWQKVANLLGVVFQKTGQAQALLKRSQQTADRVRALSSRYQGMKVLPVEVTGPHRVRAYTKMSDLAVLLDDVGLGVSFSKQKQPYVDLDGGKLAGLPADTLIVLRKPSDPPGQIKKDPVLRQLPAVKAGRVVELTAEWALKRNGPLSDEKLMNELYGQLTKGLSWKNPEPAHHMQPAKSEPSKVE
ncbi:ABC transporter substrate-binding protein [Polycladomyces subterraneus]|uniref:ABC transporter substrate-binding protein n=1 Tax=Polycladomyces subterraneus TaxID=1016997 RepID=A0ABT8INC2_9BACL|nr:ABC transporter substrate-binding protein [Polycladomyces subterraneus]MDN4594291.1 ABC transporter substrate-binding protein [Polycladomyces subterraneus]